MFSAKKVLLRHLLPLPVSPQIKELTHRSVIFHVAGISNSDPQFLQDKPLRFINSFVYFVHIWMRFIQPILLTSRHFFLHISVFILMIIFWVENHFCHLFCAIWISIGWGIFLAFSFFFCATALLLIVLVFMQICANLISLFRKIL